MTSTDSLSSGDGTLLDGGDAGTGPQHIPLNVYETTEAVVILSLIHISEPTRPY